MTIAFGAACTRCHTAGVNKRGETCAWCSGTGLEPSQKAVARRSDPQTSSQAAATVNVPRSQRIVLEVLRSHGPMTDERLVQLVRGISDSRARTARKELCGLGFVVEAGTGLTESGHKTTIWAAR